MLFRLEWRLTVSLLVASMALFFEPARGSPPESSPQAADSVAAIEQTLRRGAMNEALAAAAAASKRAPSDLALAELYIDLLVSSGQRARALTDARARATADPMSPAAHYLVGRASPDAAAAQAAYEAALKLDPSFPRAYMGMGAIHEAKGRLAESEAAYLRALQGDATLSEAWLGAARLQLRLSRKADALSTARKGLQACPNEPGLALVIADLAPEDALATLRSAITRVPDEPRLHDALAAKLLAAGDSKGALDEATKALAIDPSSSTATRTALFAKEITEGRLDLAGMKALDALRTKEALAPKAALAEYPALLQRYPRSAMVRIGSAAARKAAGDPGTLDDLLAAVSLDPSNVEAAGACGVALAQAGRPKEALPLLLTASQQRPWDPGLGLARVRALAEAGQKEEASKLSSVLASRFPYDINVLLTRSGFLVDEGKAELAYGLVRGALGWSNDPRLVAAFVRIAPVAGHPEEAAKILDQIVAQTGNPALAEAARKLRAGTIGAPPPPK